MKSILCVFAILTTATLTGCMVEPESEPDAPAASQSEVGGGATEENVDEAQQALDSNCDSRACVTCAPGKLKSRTIHYEKVCTEAGYCSCIGSPTVTYGSCLSYCAL